MSTDITERPKVLGMFRRGGNEELRVTLESYEGHPYVRFQTWELVRCGWKPKNRSCSVRIREIAGVIKLLESVEDDPYSGTRSHRTPEMNAHVPTGIKFEEIIDKGLVPPWEGDDDWLTSPSKPPRDLE